MDYKTQAGEAALEEGWTSDTIYPAGQMVVRYYCPECTAQKEAEK